MKIKNLAFYVVLMIFMFCSCSKEDIVQDIESDINQSDDTEFSTSSRNIAEDCCSAIFQEFQAAQSLCVTYGGSYCDNLASLESQFNNCVASKIIDCPPGYEYDGENCYSGKHIPPGFQWFRHNGFLYVFPNCAVTTNNNCCPNGFTFDGVNCFSGVQIPEGYDFFIYSNNGFYLEPTSKDCRDRIPGCCPEGYTYDGANCSSKVRVPQGYSAFDYKNAFYVRPNCAISTQNNCCPQGYTFDGANCRSGISFPEGHNGFIYNNTYYITPGDDCP